MRHLLILAALAACDNPTTDSGAVDAPEVREMRWACDGEDIAEVLPELGGALFSVYQARDLGGEQLEEIGSIGGGWAYYATANTGRDIEAGTLSIRCGIDTGEAVLRWLAL